MGIEIRLAMPQDIDQLVEARMAFCATVRGDEWAAENISDFEGFRESQRTYLTEFVGTDQFVGVVADDGGEIVATAFAPIYRLIPKPNNREGITAKIVGVYTVPAYRGRGIANQVMEFLLETLQARGVGRVELEYTEMAFKVYERLGFEEVTRSMGLNL